MDLKIKKGSFPITENFYERALSIPLYPSMTDSQVEKVVRDLKFFFKYFYI